jgi:hypothetical protein
MLNRFVVPDAGVSIDVTSPPQHEYIESTVVLSTVVVMLEVESGDVAVGVLVVLILTGVTDATPLY